jgi:isopenicillin N synthase-like dioxygenase
MPTQVDEAKVNAAKMVQTVEDERLIWLMDYPDSTEEIPIVDMGPYLAGECGAARKMADELRGATETVGFFYLKNHGVPQALIDRIFAEAKRFFAQPVEEKMKVPRLDNAGYVRLQEAKAHSANSSIVKNLQPALNESFIINRERAPDDPDVIAKRPFCGMNNWPENLPGFRETLLEYHATIETLGKSMLPVWAISLDMPATFFDGKFEKPHCNLRLAHYPPQAEIGNGQYGIPPHTDNCLTTFLAQSNVPGLAVQMPSGHWRVVDIIPGTLLVNTGNLMVRWTNGRYKSTKHRVINRAGVDRYSIPVFFGPDFDTMIEVMPSCITKDKPAEFEPISYMDLRLWYYGYHKGKGEAYNA